MLTLKSVLAPTNFISSVCHFILDILDPPSVHLSSTSRSIAINITHVVENLNIIYAPEYEINISGIGKITSEEPYYKIEKLNPETKYCVSVTMLYHPRFISSNITCVTTRVDDTTEATIRIMLYILAVILVIFIVFSTGYGVHKYIYADNLKQPQILNMASNNNNKVVLVKAHNVTINVMHIEPNKPPEESTMAADKEEKTWIMTNLYFKDSEYDGGHESGVTEDHGYVRLLEEVTTTRPQMSPYDMPHNLLEPSIKQTMAPLDIINTEEDLYGRIKCNTNILPIQVKKVEQANQKGEMTEETFSYLPKNDTALPKLEILHHELEETEESSIRQDVLNINVPNGMDFSECDSLFVDWSPISHHLYIPNIINKTVDEVDREECKEGEGLLSNLYKPIQIEENSEELVYLEQRWELHVKE
ncbi:hypothetical protein GDO81_008208 [Engystomops pustulosus]|uniref:Interferon/interleukin receptor domain-containing protein n=1 Tax=Engystomops pustulosus TaxID=76066 RepID=A0AAV7CCX6_ENGPU|nr:hypothetical protein GDO81_008208 [Engystomops pustulosus]